MELLGFDVPLNELLGLDVPLNEPLGLVELLPLDEPPPNEPLPLEEPPS